MSDANWMPICGVKREKVESLGIIIIAPCTNLVKIHRFFFILGFLRRSLNKICAYYS